MNKLLAVLGALLLALTPSAPAAAAGPVPHVCLYQDNQATVCADDPYVAYELCVYILIASGQFNQVTSELICAAAHNV